MKQLFTLSFTRSFQKSTASFGVLASIFAFFLLNSSPAKGADKIQFFFGPFEPTIYVEDLESFAETGEVPARLAPIASRFSTEQKAGMRTVLKAQYDISPIPVAQFTYSSLGENLLEKLGQVVQTDSFLNGKKGIRSALILAADDEAQDGLTLINALKHFPTETIQVDYSLVRQIAAENEQIFMARDSVIAQIKQAAEAQAMDKADVAMANDPQQTGRYSWQVETITFQTPGRSQSSLTDLYLPDPSSLPASEAADSKIPVVVISHGVASSRATFAYIAEHLASHGYAIAAIEHRETSAEKFSRFFWGKEQAPGGEELLLRSKDITALLDTLSAQQASGEQQLAGLNLASVGLFGQSLGGYTVLASAGAGIDPAFLAEECQSELAERPTLNLSMLTQCTLLDMPPQTSLAIGDQRVSAVVALNPLTSSIFGRSGLQQIEVPVMMMASTDDYVAPALPEQIEPFTWLTTDHKKLVLIEKGTHFSFLDRNSQSVLPFADSLMGPDPMAARAPTKALSLAFYNRHLQQQTDAEQFLNQAYLNQLPKEPFEFSVIDSLASSSSLFRN